MSEKYKYAGDGSHLSLRHVDVAILYGLGQKDRAYAIAKYLRPTTVKVGITEELTEEETREFKQEIKEKLRAENEVIYLNGRSKQQDSLIDSLRRFLKG